MYAGLKMPAPDNKKKTISSYDGFFLNVFYACALQFYDVFFFYHKAYLVFLLLLISLLFAVILNLKNTAIYFSIFIRSSTSFV